MKNFTRRDYDKYMYAVKEVVEDTEMKMKMLEKNKRMLLLSFDDWVKFQNGDKNIINIIKGVK